MNMEQAGGKSLLAWYLLIQINIYPAVFDAAQMDDGVNKNDAIGKMDDSLLLLR
jgi:hypothetical protein